MKKHISDLEKMQNTGINWPWLAFLCSAAQMGKGISSPWETDNQQQTTKTKISELKRK